MKKPVIVLFFLICLISLVFGKTTEAATRQEDTNIGITFSSDQKSAIEPPSKVTPGPPKSIGKLPSTGELITSVIWMLLGSSVLIFFVGIVSLRAVMSKNVWERVC
ncbi:hypothetical protein [Enterococcus rotai]|uniref:hypothetical protein n=1 Tax=Enterococcus rotai TaxID=118060 RepID=UPI0032B37F3C